MKPVQIKLMSLMFILLVSFSSLAGNEGRGGIPKEITVEAFTKYITGEGLKISTLNYLKTLNLNRITDPTFAEVVKAFNRMLNNNLFKDLSQSMYLAGLENCKKGNSDNTSPEFLNPNVRAWTNTGDDSTYNIGGSVCFDINGLVTDYLSQGISVEQAAKNLTALAFHEHVHHFQYASGNQEVIKKQEEEANSVGAYVLWHSRPAHEPFIEWTDGPDHEIVGGLDELLNKISGTTYVPLEYSNDACQMHIQKSWGKTLLLTIMSSNGPNARQYPYCYHITFSPKNVTLNCNEAKKSCTLTTVSKPREYESVRIYPNVSTCRSEFTYYSGRIYTTTEIQFLVNGDFIYTSTGKFLDYKPEYFSDGCYPNYRETFSNTPTKYIPQTMRR